MFYLFLVAIDYRLEIVRTLRGNAMRIEWVQSHPPNIQHHHCVKYVTKYITQHPLYPLVNVYITLENHHAFLMGKSTISMAMASIAYRAYTMVSGCFWVSMQRSFGRPSGGSIDQGGTCPARCAAQAPSQVEKSLGKHGAK